MISGQSEGSYLSVIVRFGSAGSQDSISYIFEICNKCIVNDFEKKQHTIHYHFSGIIFTANDEKRWEKDIPDKRPIQRHIVIHERLSRYAESNHDNNDNEHEHQEFHRHIEHHVELWTKLFDY